MRHNFKFLLIFLFALDSILCYAQQGLPIKPTRTISFSTREGTYMDVDVSPDGKTLVFDILGDLYTVAVTGGKATQLTRGVALNVRPVWSPDARKIAYLSDYSGIWQVNVSDLQTKARTVIGPPDEALDYDLDLVWSADGNHIIARDRVYGLTGGKFDLGVKPDQLLRLTQDGKSTLFTDSGLVYQFDPAVKKKTVIAKVPELVNGNCHNVVLSSNGRWLCYYVAESDLSRRLMIQDLVNGTSRSLVPQLMLRTSYDPHVPFNHYCFSPDSKCVFVSYKGKIHQIDVENGKDHEIPFTADVKADLGPLDYHTFRIGYGSIQSKFARSAHASPDGKHLVFSALDKIYIKDLPAGKVRLLVSQPFGQFQPVYSPDGKWIAYVSWQDTIGGHVWRVPAKGGQPVQLTREPGLYESPAWAPDGGSIAVTMAKAMHNRTDERRAIASLQLLSLHAGGIKAIDDSIPLVNNLSFAADGDRIFYTPSQNLLSKKELKGSILKPQLISRNLNTGKREVIAIGDAPTFFASKSLSPDGRYIVYSKAEDLYLAPVYSGGKPIALSDRFSHVQVIRFVAGIEPHWVNNNVISWTYGKNFYRIRVDKIMAAAGRMFQNKIAYWSHGGITGTLNNGLNNALKVDVRPDDVIDLSTGYQANYGHGLIALQNARILTMRGNRVIEHGTVIIRDGRIVSVGASSAITIPPVAKVYDLTGKTIIPGLIDLHLHMPVPPNVFPQQSWMFLTSLAYGITTARDPSQTYDAFGYAELLRSGQMIGPRLFTVGVPVIDDDGITRVDEANDAQRVAQKRALLGGTVVKNYLSPFLRGQRQWLLQASNEAGMNLTNEGYVYPIGQWGMIKDGSTGVEHNPALGDVYQDMLLLYAKSGTWFTPTLQVTGNPNPETTKEYFNYTYWHQPDDKLKRFSFHDAKMRPVVQGPESIEVIEKVKPGDGSYDGLLTYSGIDARIRHFGGRVTLGSHGNDQGIGPHNELWALQMGGLTNMEALQAATIMGTEALGIQKDVGSIEVGKIADLVILNSNPLQDIHNSRDIKYVMKDGILYDGDNLDELWPIKKKCPEWKMKEERY
ncbi:amidohydrolase family protein [Mucilaginibacter sp. AW1-3]